MNGYLLDTSALAARFFEEDGWQTVEGIIMVEDTHAVCALSLFELHVLLKARGMARTDVTTAMGLFDEVLGDVLSVDRAVVKQAIRLRDESPERLPMGDAIIAGCAVVHGLTLVCRDNHFSGIPERHLKQLRLPSHGNRT